jgi:putative acetyltransferase
MLLREERPENFGEIHRLVEAAFKTAKVSNGDEQHFVERLRAGPGYIPELALAAEEKGVLVGHVMLTRLPLKLDDGREVRNLLLAPLSVLFDQRGRGVGAELIREALRRAGEMGFEAVFLAGDPDYYGRFGFRRGDSFGVHCKQELPPQFVLAKELREGGPRPGSAGDR